MAARLPQARGFALRNFADPRGAGQSHEEQSGKSAEGLEWYEEFIHLKMSCTGVRLGLLRGQTMMDEATMARRLQVQR